MKKSIYILLAVFVLIGLAMTSCNNDVQPLKEELVYVSFGEGSARALTATLESFNAKDYYWSYEAQKNDGSGLKSGETDAWNETGAGSLQVQAGKGLNTIVGELESPTKVPGFSKGFWNFRLFAYQDQARTKLAYWGEADGVLIDSDHHLASVIVSPTTTGDGYLKIGTITFNPASASSVPTDLVIYTDEVRKLEGTEWVIVTETPDDQGVYTLPARQYKFTRTYSYQGIPVASGSVIVTVYPNLTTTISGSLSELTSYAQFYAEQNPDAVNVSAEATGITYDDSTATAGYVLETPSTAEKAVTAAITKNSVDKIMESIQESDSAIDLSASTTNMTLALGVDTTGATETSIEYEISMTATINYKETLGPQEVVDRTTIADVRNVADYVTAVIPMQTGLESVTVKHSGLTMKAISDPAVYDPDDDTSSVIDGVTIWAGFYNYNATTGVLSIVTRSFSPFTLTYVIPSYVAAIESKMYDSLLAAIVDAKKGDTILLLCDVTTDDGYIIDNEDLTIDTNGHIITVNVGAKTNNRAFRIDGGKLTVLGGGVIDAKGQATNPTGTAGTGCYGAFRAEVETELYLKDITLKNYRPWGLNVKILGAHAEMDNVKIVSVCGGGIEVTDDDGAAGTVRGYAKLTNCVIEQSGWRDWCSVPVSVSGASTVDVYSSSYTGEYGAYVFSSGGTINIYGGAFTANDEHNVLITSYDAGYGNDSVINVYDGSFTGKFSVGTSGHEFLNIKGGTFDHDPTAYVVDGYIADYDTQTSLWTVREAGDDDYVAAVKQGELIKKKYLSLKSAVDAALDGETVLLLKSTSVPAEIEVKAGMNLTIDLNGKVITGTEHVKSKAVFRNKGNLTIDGTTEGSAINADAIAVASIETATLTVNGGSYSNSYLESDGGAYIFDINGEATIDGITITGVIKGIRAEGSSAKVTVSNSTADVAPSWGLFAVGEYGELSITSGSYTTTYDDQRQMLDFKSNGIITISGGSFETVYVGTPPTYIPALAVFNGGTAAADIGERLVITGGSFKYAGKLGYINGSKHEVVSISGGSFDVSSVVIDNGASDNVLEYSITGGSYTTDPSAYVAPGYVAYYNGSKYVVVETWENYASESLTKVDDTYQIASAADLAYLVKNPSSFESGAKFLVTADIDLSAHYWKPISGIDRIVFDGGNKTISNMKAVGFKDVGLFSYNNAAVYENIKISKSEVIGINHVGGIVGGGMNATIGNCHVENSTLTAFVCNNDDGDKVGGIAGYLSSEWNAYITGCTVTGCTIRGYRDLGGIAGIANASSDYVKPYVPRYYERIVTGNSVSSTTIISDITNNYKELNPEADVLNVHDFIGRCPSVSGLPEGYEYDDVITGNVATDVTIQITPSNGLSNTQLCR